MYNVHLPIMLESERQAVYRERKKERTGYLHETLEMCCVAIFIA